MLAERFAGVALKDELQESVTCNQGSMQDDEIHTSFETHEKSKIYMSHFAYACKMRYPLNLVLENIEYLSFY